MQSDKTTWHKLALSRNRPRNCAALKQQFLDLSVDSSGSTDLATIRNGELHDSGNGLLDGLCTHGLGDIIIHPRFQAALAVTFHGVGSQGNDGHPDSAPCW